MNSEDIPIQSTKSLINACLVAVLLATVILFTAVLPAEYGIDLTGLGNKLGLIALSEISQQNLPLDAEDCSKPKQDVVVNQPQVATAKPTGDNHPLENSKSIQWKDSVNIVIPPQKGLEYKFAMAKDAVLEYSWKTDGVPIYFDFHGEPKGATDGYFKSYLEITSNESKGVLTTPFEGIHGWYWENKTAQPITIQLSTNGKYEVLGVMK